MPLVTGWEPAIVDRTSLLEAQDLLDRWGGFDEALLHDVRSTDGMFNLELVFNVIRIDGEVRSNLSDPMLVALRLEGIERLRYEGGLTDGMRESPERIDWGFSEISVVRADEDSDGNLVIRVLWELTKMIEVVCHRMVTHE
jgi:hypothetical protein